MIDKDRLRFIKNKDEELRFILSKIEIKNGVNVAREEELDLSALMSFM